MNISVVIPTLEEEDNIPTCLSCIDSQKQEGDEVIIVDGGSEDGTVDKSKGAADRVFVAIDEDGNPATIGRSRNIGAEEAKNEIIATTDADALPPDGWLETIRHEFSSDEDLAVLYGSIEDKNGVPIRNLVGKFSTVLRGASGNNTAFRKSKFDELDSGYKDINFMEDVFIINDLAKVGKVKRNENMVMVMDMDRKRYQTYPILTAGILGSVVSSMVGGETGDMLTGASVGLAGTELVYEDLSDNNISMHHDEIGANLGVIGSSLGDSMGRKILGTGAGIMIHHAVTEGVSFMPTDLGRNTDEVIKGV